MIKILIDAHVFDGKPQGTVTYLQGLYSELVRIPNDVHYYFAAQNCDNLKAIFGEATNITYIKLCSNNKYLRLVLEFTYIVWKYKIDYAHFQYISPLIKCCKEIVTIHDLLFLDFPSYFQDRYRIVNKFLFRRSVRRADFLVAVSTYSRDAIERHFQIPKAQIYVTPNGYKASSFHTSKENDERFLEKYQLLKYLLYVSRFEPRKNHFELLKAFVEMELWKEGFKLVLIGVKDLPVPLFDKYYNGLSDDIKKNILLLQNISNDDLTLFYRNTDLFVFPSFAEGFGIPPLEAYLNGAKVACSNQTAMSDFIFLSDGFFDPNDFEQMKKIIRYKLDQTPHANSQIDEIFENYSWKKIAQGFSEFLFENKR